VLPLIFEKLDQGILFVNNLLKELTFDEYKFIYDEIKSNVFNNAGIGKPMAPPISIWIDYCKALLEKERSNILKSINAISVSGKKLLDAKIAFNANRHEILLNLYSDNEETATVKFFNIFGGLEYESNYYVHKGQQNISINASDFKKGIYIIQITINGNTISQKINI